MFFAAGRLLGTVRSAQRITFEAQLPDSRASVRSVTTSRMTFLEEMAREALEGRKVNSNEFIHG